MQLGMIGLGRMGANMVRRLAAAGHECVVFDVAPGAAESLAREKLGPSPVRAAASLADAVRQLAPPRALWLMLPAAVVDGTIEQLAAHLQADDTLIDGGNSFYIDDLRRSAAMRSRGVHYLDVGTSGGVWGLKRGYCLMIGGDDDAVTRLDPIFRSLAPGLDAAPRLPERQGTPTTAEHGYLHCGPSGAGHFVKMVHNAIEYGIMASYAEGLNILKHADVGKRKHDIDAETTPLRAPEHYQYNFNLVEISEVWRRGSVIASWLLDLTARALVEDPRLDGFEGRVSDSGEGRWTIQAAIESGAPAHVLSAALFQRFASRGEDEFAERLLSAMRYQFGGHKEKGAPVQ